VNDRRRYTQRVVGRGPALESGWCACCAAHTRAADNYGSNPIRFLLKLVRCRADNQIGSFALERTLALLPALGALAAAGMLAAGAGPLEQPALRRCHHLPDFRCLPLHAHGCPFAPIPAKIIFIEQP